MENTRTTPPPIFTVDQEVQIRSMESSFLGKMFLWMFGALMLTGTSAFVFASQGYTLWLMSRPELFIGIGIIELILVIGFSATINKISFNTALILMLIYAIVNGITISVILYAYTRVQIASTFFITAATFGAMAAFGSTTKIKLSRYTRFAYMALIGLIIATVISFFMKSSALMWLINIVGVLLFTALTAIDTYRYREYYKKLMLQGASGESLAKLALIGSLNLYLDFINLFLYLLRFVGRSN